ncbi:hypothetical protein [Microbacterium enclense]|uniref:hypothetical protein n=1 Tax=Microbacterium enclense TaxID=993073 RepID=UPI003F81D49C
MWATTARSILSSSNVSVALRAIDAKIPVMSDHRAAEWEISAAIREACWWVASLDDLLLDKLLEPEKTRYRQVRDSDVRGQVVEGVTWARHRHSHQLATGTVQEGDLRPFLGGGEDAVFFISSPWRWVPVDAMGLSAGELEKSRRKQPAYEKHVANHPVEDTFRSARAWFVGLRDDTL